MSAVADDVAFVLMLLGVFVGGIVLGVWLRGRYGP